MRPVIKICAAATVAVALAGFAACLPQKKNSKLNAQELQDEWTKREWISKVARVLGGGTHAISDEKLEELAPLPKEEVVDKLMTGLPYTLTLIDFLDFYTNTKMENPGGFGGLGSIQDLNQLLQNSRFGPRIPSLAAAAAIQQGSEFFTFFDQKPPLPQMKYVASAVGIGTLNPAPSNQLELVDQHRDGALAAHDEVTAKLAAEGDPKDVLKGFCDVAFNQNFTPPDIGSRIRTFLIGAGLANESFQIMGSWYEPIRTDCFTAGSGIGSGSGSGSGSGEGSEVDPDQGGTPVDVTLIVARIKDRLQAVREKIPQVFAYAAKFNTAVYDPKDLAEVRFETAPDFSVPGAPNNQNFGGFGGSFPFLPFGVLPNSSTNYNRKRGAYMLRTFFCDDLTPISVVANDDHSADEHGSNPGCQACHYKLDPMGGFFKDREAFGQVAPKGEDGKTNRIQFEDGLVLEGDALAKYMKTWKAAPDAGRAWNVGYVRSTTKPQLNFYGETLEDLYAFMPKAPEVRQCLVRRLAEYFIGKNQVFDGEWLDHLSKEIPGEGNASAGTTGKAVSKIIKTLVLSNTFAEPDPNPAKCYDFAPGAEQSTLPCEISWTLKTNCESCHNGDGAIAGLDLFGWKALAGGEGFPHVDDDGNQIDRMETFKRIKDRLETPNKNRRMPKNREMSAVDRARLFKWVDGLITADNSGSTEQTP